MRQIRKRRIEAAVWIPLRANQTQKEGEFGYEGYKEDYFGVGTLAVPIDAHDLAEELDWNDIGIGRSHRPTVQKGAYFSSDLDPLSEDHTGVRLIIEQHLNSAEEIEWHLHQDFVVALGLKRERDTWISVNDGYVEVARLQRDVNGEPEIIECRAEYLKDYLCARGLALVLASYRQRLFIASTADHIKWKSNPYTVQSGPDSWEGSVSEIHEGGQPFGRGVSVLRVGYSEIDAEVEVPKFGVLPNEETVVESSHVKYEGNKLYLIQGALWRVQRLAPAEQSPRVRGDESAPIATFITDAEGKREDKRTLAAERRWLWFRPHVIPAILQIRGARLAWHTRDTGHIWCSPDYGVHFGVNRPCLINVYAKDIGMLPDWQQQIWAGHNIGPEGGVSEELLAAQMKARPADTQAPEAFLKHGLEQLRQASLNKIGESVLRDHADIADLVKRCHRFRPVEQGGLFALAKDLARLTADSFDVATLRRAIPEKDTELGSLKLVERLIAGSTSKETARKMVGPLFGIYELRLADAHLAHSDLAESLKLAGVDSEAPLVFQGFQLVHACVATLYLMAEALTK